MSIETLQLIFYVLALVFIVAVGTTLTVALIYFILVLKTWHEIIKAWHYHLERLTEKLINPGALVAMFTAFLKGFNWVRKSRSKKDD